MHKRVALYSRVSTSGQTVENQQRELREMAARNGWQIVREFEDVGISGAKGRADRPGFDALLKAITRKEIDLVAAWSVDRLGRSLRDLVETLGELHHKHVGLYLHQQGVDTTTPAGKALFQMMGVFAEFERAMMQERIKSGLDRARAQGRRLGRPKISEKVEHAIRKAHAAGTGLRKIARELGVGVSVVQRVTASTPT